MGAGINGERGRCHFENFLISGSGVGINENGEGGGEDFQSNFLIIMGGVIAIPKLRVGYRSENFKGN